MVVFQILTSWGTRHLYFRGELLVWIWSSDFRRPLLLNDVRRLPISQLASYSPAISMKAFGPVEMGYHGCSRFKRILRLDFVAHSH
jgi:hypothetical protein